MITLFQQQTTTTPSVTTTHFSDQTTPATPRTKNSRVRSTDALPPRPAPFRRREETNQDMENDGWGNDDLNLDQTMIQSQTPEGNPTPPSLPEEEGMA